MTANPEVSVLLPVRDAAPWLDECLESLYAQSMVACEIIAVDDGSNDGSARMLAEHASREPRLRVFATVPERRGLVAALNRGLMEVRGKYVARMDADDVTLPERLAKQAALLDENESLAAVTCRVEGFPGPELGAGMRRYLDWQNALVTPEDIKRDRFVESPLIAPSLVIRTEFLRAKLAGWQDQEWPEDWDLLLRAFAVGAAIARVPQVLLRWRQHSRQATRTDPRYAASQLLRARAHHLTRFLATAASAREVWLLGAGPVGKLLAAALFQQGFAVAGFADVDPDKIGNRVRRAGCTWPVVSMERLLASHGRVFAVAAVGVAGARVRIRRELVAAGWREESDFIAAA